MNINNETIENLAAELESIQSFSGGPKMHFNTAGERTLKLLSERGIKSNSKTLDIGCGCLRIGIKLINYLDPGNYFGIEPNKPMLDTGIKHLLSDSLRELKTPSFSYNDRFSVEDFKIKSFDCVVARSIWTHAPKTQIALMLDLFKESSTQNAKFFTSVLKKNPYPDYLGTTWVGRSHESVREGVVHHNMKWIREQCNARSMRVRKIRDAELNFGNQVWLEIQKNETQASC